MKLDRRSVLSALALLAVLVIVAMASLVLKKQASLSLLGDAITGYRYTIDGKPIGGAVLSFPFTSASQDEYVMNVLIDLNGDGELSVPDEWVARNRKAWIAANYSNNVMFPWLATSTNAEVKTRIILTTEEVPADWNGAYPTKGFYKEKSVALADYELAEIMGYNVPGASENLKRGPAAIFQVAQGSPTTIIARPTGSRPTEARLGGDIPPDYAQGSMECTLASIANNLSHMAREHGREDDVPRFGPAFIQELKKDFTFNNGVLLQNIVPGKNAFVARMNLPVATEKIDHPTRQQIVDALASGANVELSMSFVRSASGLPNTGHVVTLTGANSTANGFIEAHDSGTPLGLDTYNFSTDVQIRGQRYTGIDYPMWDGIAYIDAIIVQRWTGTEPARTGTQTDPGGQKSVVQMLLINGSYFPKSQFRVAEADACDALHYHAGTVYGLRDANSTSTVSLNETDPNCGFGRVADIPVVDLEITLEQSTALISQTVR